MKYYPGFAGTTMDSIPPTLRKFGFTVADKVPFNEKKAAIQLLSQPVIVSGYNEYQLFQGSGGGHCFVLDGLIQYGEYHKYKDSDIAYKYLPAFYFHCIWGNSGKGNGYYYFAKNYSFGGSCVEMDDDDWGDGEHNPAYDYDIQMIPAVTLK